MHILLPVTDNQCKRENDRMHHRLHNGAQWSCAMEPGGDKISEAASSNSFKSLKFIIVCHFRSITKQDIKCN